MAVTLTVGVVAKPFQAGSLEIVETINGRASLRVKVYDSTGSYTPDLNYPLLVDVDATNVFTGVVTGIQTSWPTFGVGKILELEAADHSFLAERMVIKGSTTGGITGRDVADYVVDNYLGPAFGVTRDVGMAAGGTLGALAIDYTKISDVFDMVLRLVAADGWCWRIDEDKVLVAFLPSVGAYPCPFTIEDGDPNMIGDFTVRRVLEEYANRVYYSYNDGTQTPAVVTAENSSLITAHGLYEAAFSTRNELDAATAQSICDGYLTALSHVPVEVKLTTMEAGARAGQTLTIDITNRLAGDFLIHEVRTRTTDGAHVFYDITAMEGAIRKPKYLETYKLWAGVGGTAPPGGSTSSTGCSSPVEILSEDFSAGSSVIDTVGDFVYEQGSDGVDPNYPQITRADYISISGGRAGIRPDSSFWYAGAIWAAGLTFDGSTARIGATYYPDATALADTLGYYPLVSLWRDDGITAHLSFDYDASDGNLKVWWRESAVTGGTGIAVATISIPYSFTADAEYVVSVRFRCGTIAGGSVASDGYIQCSINGAVVFSRTGIPIYFSDLDGGDNVVPGVSWGFYGLIGPVTNLSVVTCGS